LWATFRPTRYEFENVEVDVDRYELRRDGRPVHVERQVFDVLQYLIAHRERVVPKSELLDQVWGIIRTAFGRG
jgi:DNA-binding winged helix-turn-helix (wHTH) protein